MSGAEDTQRMNSKQTPYTSPSRRSYGMPFVKILEKIDRVKRHRTIYISIYMQFIEGTDHNVHTHYCTTPPQANLDSFNDIYSISDMQMIELFICQNVCNIIQINNGHPWIRLLDVPAFMNILLSVLNFNGIIFCYTTVGTLVFIHKHYAPPLK